MNLKVHTIRFSKDYFSDYESCAKWLEEKNVEVSGWKEVEKFWIFNKVSEEKFNETSIQEFNLGAGIIALVGLAEDMPASMENVTDTDVVSPTDVSTGNKISENEQLKATLTAQTASLNGFVQQLQDALAPIKTMLNQATSQVTKNEDSNSVEIYVPIVKVAEKRQVFGEVLVPNAVDGQGHIYSQAEVEKAAHYWMKEFSQLGEMHKAMLGDGQISILETFVAPSSFTFSDGDNERTIKKGTWLLKVYVEDDEIWEKVKNGELNGFSIGGVATVEELD